MKEGKAFCYKKCPHEHDCFGGYLEGKTLCDKEIKRIKENLREENPDNTILFAPQNGTGLRFKIIKSPFQEVVYRLHEGKINLFIQNPEKK